MEQLETLALEIKTAGLSSTLRSTSSGRKPSLQTRIVELTAFITRMGWLILRANGFVKATSVENTAATIVLQFRIADGVGWEHWWLELPGPRRTTVGTDSNRYDVEASDDEAHMSRDLPDEGFGVVKFPVTGIERAHLKILEQLVAATTDTTMSDDPP